MNAKTPQAAAKHSADVPECYAVQPQEIDTATASALIESRAISEELTKTFGVSAERVGHGIDPVTETAVVRVEAGGVIIALAVPETGQPYVIQRHGQRLMELTATRRRRAQPKAVAAEFFAELKSRHLV